MTQPNEYLTTAEVAAELRLHPETIRRWINEGKLPALRVAASSYRIERTDLEQLKSELRVTAGES